jgi:anti-sigma factor ChrR (cupin superfamily)
MILVRQDARDWSATDFEGVENCPIWFGDQDEGGYLARFAAGASFPRHGHEGWEQIVILKGAIRFNEVEMRVGDVLQVDADDEHEAYALEETVLCVSRHGAIKFKE